MVPRLFCAIAALALTPATDARATFQSIADLNSSAFVEDQDTAGLFGWRTDTTHALTYQSYFFRFDSLPFELPVDTTSLTLTASSLVDTNPMVDPRPDTFTARYEGFGLAIEPAWKLRGSSPGSGQSEIGSSVLITNNTTDPVRFTLFQFTDCDIDGTTTGDTVRLAGNPVHAALQHEPGAGAVTQSILAPAPARWQVGHYLPLLSQLLDLLPTNLNNNAGPLDQGDVVWALQWEVTIEPGRSALISTQKFFAVPAPGAPGAAILALALLRNRPRRDR